jgi:hypothetical protein
MGDGDAMAEYINLIKDIFKLNYGPISTPIIFMRCAWFRNGNDVKGNPTFRWDEARFLVCNFWYMMAKDEKPFGFLVQVQQVFFMDEKQNPSWKVVVEREFRSPRIMTNTFATLSGINDGVSWLNTPMTHPPMPQGATLMGAKELLAKELTIINSTFAHVD